MDVSDERKKQAMNKPGGHIRDAFLADGAILNGLSEILPPVSSQRHHHVETSIGT